MRGKYRKRENGMNMTGVDICTIGLMSRVHGIMDFQDDPGLKKALDELPESKDDRKNGEQRRREVMLEHWMAKKRDEVLKIEQYFRAGRELGTIAKTMRTMTETGFGSGSGVGRAKRRKRVT